MIAARLFLVVVLSLGYWILADLPTVWRVGAYLCLVAAATAMLCTAQGTPRPRALQFATVSGDLVGQSEDEGRAIYVWVRPDGDASPIALALPWSDQTAARTESAQADAARTGRPARVVVRGALAVLDGPQDLGSDGIAQSPAMADSLPGPDSPLTVQTRPGAPAAVKP